LVNILFRFDVFRPLSEAVNATEKMGIKTGVRRTVRKVADYFTLISLILVVIAASAWFGRLGESEYAGPFKAIDGDSLASGETRFRLEGIDAPEYRQNCRKRGADWPCGRESTRFLRTLISRSDAICTGLGVDKYDRVLAHCSAGSTDINGEMVEQGWAVSFGDYQGHENRARASNRGIWSGEFIRPSQWRDLHADANSSEFEEADMSGLPTRILARVRLWWQAVWR